MAKFKFFSVGGEADTDTNTNLANTDLTSSGTRTFDIGGNTLTFEDGGTDIIQLDSADNTLKIGATSKYEMPTSRSSAQYKSLVATNTGGSTSFEQQVGWSVLQLSANIGTIADGEHEIIGSGTSFDADDLDNITFAELSAIPPFIPSAQTGMVTSLVYCQTLIALSEAGIGKGQCLLGMVNGGASGSTDFDLSSTKATIFTIGCPAVANQIEVKADKLTIANVNGKNYWFYIENKSGASFTNVYFWCNIWYQTDVWYR